MSRKRRNSREPRLAAPSAMLVGTGEPGPAHLNRQAKAFRLGPCICHPIEFQRQVVCGTPGIKTLIGDHPVILNRSLRHGSTSATLPVPPDPPDPCPDP
jgi:hypothetical protein